MLLLHLSFALGCLTAVSIGHSNTVCNPVTSLCFEQLFMRNLNVTIGFAFPPKQEQQFVNEVLVLVYLFNCVDMSTDTSQSFPLPYGFAGVMLGEESTLTKKSSVIGLSIFADFVTAAQASESNFSIADCRAQMVTPGSNHSLIPILSAPIITTFSPLTTWGTNAAQFIFRCQNCSIVTDYFAKNGEVKLTTLLSTSYPEYLDDTMTIANLSLVGEEHQESTLSPAAAPQIPPGERIPIEVQEILVPILLTRDALSGDVVHAPDRVGVAVVCVCVSELPIENPAKRSGGQGTVDQLRPIEPGSYGKQRLSLVSRRQRLQQFSARASHVVVYRQDITGTPFNAYNKWTTNEKFQQIARSCADPGPFKMLAGPPADCSPEYELENKNPLMYPLLARLQMYLITQGSFTASDF
ncbi:hypothetical protein B0H13DRAFT_2349525 [Mycena leptocephala]|nr:hypothetical protein B0H13DRAFT_2349525 [Mycena leptocephala]